LNRSIERATIEPNKYTTPQNGTTTTRLRTFRLRHFVYKHFV